MFNKDDIELTLYFKGEEKSGSYNQLGWNTHPGTDATDFMTNVVSIHEFFHNDLNNLTCYGFILTGFAYLSNEESDNKTYYRSTLHELIKRCKTTHEAYATWVGLNVFRKNTSDNIHEPILTNYPEYQYYYKCADHIVSGLKSIYLQQQALTTSIRFCFQSAVIAETVLNNIEAFDFSTIRSAEFPDERFRYLRENLPRDFMETCILSFINKLNDSSTDYKLLLNAFMGNEDKGALLAMDKEYLSEDLSTYIYQCLQQYYDKLGQASIGYKDYLEYFKSIMARLNSLHPFSESRKPLLLNNAPNDTVRNIPLSFQGEVLLFSNSTLPCRLLLPSKIDAETKAFILRGCGEEAHLFITARYGPTMKDQYHFKLQEDEDRFNALDGPFTAIRFASMWQGERTIFYVPFNEPSELILFLKEAGSDLPILGCISTYITFHTEWWDKWFDFFSTQCTFRCLLGDYSPVYFIENVFSKEAGSSYGKLIIKSAEIRQPALILQVKQAGEIQILMLAPCSEMHFKALLAFMQTKHPSIKNDIELREPIYKHLPTVLTHIAREEHCYYFYSHGNN